jgi:hypothetical protein
VLRSIQTEVVASAMAVACVAVLRSIQMEVVVGAAAVLRRAPLLPVA